MTHNEAIYYIHEHGTELFERDRSGKGWICPICGSGSGPHGTGITTRDGVHFTCWTGCFTSADVIDIIGLMNNIPEDDRYFPERLQAAAREFNITLNDDAGNVSQGHQQRLINKNINTESKSLKNYNSINFDYTPYFLEANLNLGKTDYHRGLSIETLNRFKVGFVELWRHPKSPQTVPATPRLIIPTSPYSYIARDTRAVIPPEEEQYKKQKVGSNRGVVFNEQALKTANAPVFVCEGEFDCLSFIDVGAAAITAGSAAQWETVADFVIANRPEYPIIIAFDNDATGHEKGGKLEAKLKEAGITVTGYTPPNGAKDANEALMKDRARFTDSVNEAIQDTLEIFHFQVEERRRRVNFEREKYLRQSASYQLKDFILGIEAAKTANFFETGFKSLDKVLDGGLYAGLYIFGAISSLGKTSLCLQICDNIASSGRDVLIFSLEMAKSELIAKSISRNTFLIARERKQTRLAKTTRGILMGSRYDSYSEADIEVIKSALENYGLYAGHLFIHEGIGDIGVAQVREVVERHIRITGNTPVVLVDYLQILASYAERLTDKQSVDKSVLELKRLSRDYSIPVIGISSFNRDNYTVPVNMASFKESGAVEYSSDVLIGLQYDGFDYIEGETDGNRLKRVRELLKAQSTIAKSGDAQKIQVKILKNRNGSKGDVLLNYWPMFNYFESDSDESRADDWHTIEPQEERTWC